MAVKVRERGGAWWIYVDFKGRRKARRVGKGQGARRAAVAAAETIRARLALGDLSALETPQPTPPPVTFEQYAAQWLTAHAVQACKFSTTRVYESNLTRHVYRVLGATPIDKIARADCRTLIAACRDKKLSPKSIENVCRTVSSVLSQAVEDGLLAANPAFRLGRYYRKRDEETPKLVPLTREEATRFLAAARAHFPRAYPLFLCALRTGLRLGELLGLQWGDVDFHGRFLEVRRNLVAGRLTTPKNRKSRHVDMSTQLTGTLRELHVARKAEALRRGWGRVPKWVFSTEDGGPLDGDNLRSRVFYRVLEKAGLRHVRFHDLRHTFASLLIAQGESLAYVRDQLGHSSIQVTVDTYGHLIPGTNRQAVDRLDDPVPSQPELSEETELHRHSPPHTSRRRRPTNPAPEAGSL